METTMEKSYLGTPDLTIFIGEVCCVSYIEKQRSFLMTYVSKQPVTLHSTRLKLVAVYKYEKLQLCDLICLPPVFLLNMVFSH